MPRVSGVSELIELRIRDLDLDNKVMRVIGKGDKQRLLPLHDEAVRVLKHYPLAGAGAWQGSTRLF